MRNFELQPTQENLIMTFEEDVLGRDIDIYNFVHLINEIDTSHSIALNAEWGAGKTFFVKQVKMVLDAYNTFTSNLDQKIIERIHSKFESFSSRKEGEIQPQVTVYYDAWTHDNDEDPVLSLIYAILQSISVDYNFKYDKSAFEIAASIGEALTGHALTALKSALESKDPFEELKRKSRLEDQVKEFLQATLPERGNRLVIIIDELDRCTPSYAIKLLERIKHYFCNDNITFIFSINIAELQHTVKKYYGNEFDACRYLDRFFDLSIELPPADLSELYRKIGFGNDTYVYERFCKRVADVNYFSIREKLKFLKMARAAAYKPVHNSQNFCFGEEKAELFCLMYFVPIMIALKMKDRTSYKSFVEGRNSEPLTRFASEDIIGRGIMKSLLNNNEVYESTNTDSSCVVVKVKDKLLEVYHAVFSHVYESGTYEVRIGEALFYRETKEKLLKVVSLLSDYTDYNF